MKRTIILFFIIFTYVCNIYSQSAIKQSQIQAYDTFNNKYEGKWKISWNRKTGAVSSLYGFKTKKYNGSPTDAAKSFLIENHEMLGLKKDLSDLILDKVNDYKGIKHITFKQFYKDIPVFTGEFSVHMDKNNQINMTNGRYFTNIQIDTEPQISVQQAVNKAMEEINYQKELNNEPDAELIIYPDNENFILVWKIKLDFWPEAIFECFIDAQNNEMIKYKNRIIGVDGKANIYPIDPSNSSLAINETLYRLDGNHYLDGLYTSVYCRTIERAYSTNHKFLYETDDEHFDQANLYWHVDKIANDYFNSKFSYNIDRIDAFIKGGGGAGYSPDLNEIYFCTGDTTNPEFTVHFRNAARKDDIIYHEYTHAITCHIGLGYDTDESLARNEGYSDYFPASFTNDYHIGEWWIYEYDDLRIVSNDPGYYNYKNWATVTYNENPPAPYGRSMIWSGALWDLREALGNDIADEIIFKGLYYAKGNTNFETGRDGIIQADIIFYDGQHEQTIIDIFQERGVGKPYTPTGFTLEGDTGGNPQLSWDANGEPDIDAYRLYQSIDGSPYSLLIELDKNTTSFTDPGVIIGDGRFDPTVCYRVAAIDIHDQESDPTFPKCTKFSGLNKTPDCGECSKLPEDYILYGAYPNPFNSTTKIRFALPENARVRLEVYNVLGKKLFEASDKIYAAGYHTIYFDANNIASGIYFYTFEAIGIESESVFKDSKRFLLIK